MNADYNMNPYHNQRDPLANVPVTPLMIEHLRATKPWVRFMSVIMFIMVGFMILAGIAMMFIPSPMGSYGVGPLIGIIYIVMSGLYIAPAFFLHKFASSIQAFLQGGGDSAMETALESQKSFWRFVGILTLVVIVLYGLFFILAMLGAMATMFR